MVVIFVSCDAINAKRHAEELDASFRASGRGKLWVPRLSGLFLDLCDGSCCQSCLGWGIMMLTWGGAALTRTARKAWEILMGLKSGGLWLDFIASLLSCSTLLSWRCDPWTPECTCLICHQKVFESQGPLKNQASPTWLCPSAKCPFMGTAGWASWVLHSCCWNYAHFPTVGPITFFDFFCPEPVMLSFLFFLITSTKIPQV